MGLLSWLRSKFGKLTSEPPVRRLQYVQQPLRRYEGRSIGVYRSNDASQQPDLLIDDAARAAIVEIAIGEALLNEASSDSSSDTPPSSDDYSGGGGGFGGGGSSGDW